MIETVAEQDPGCAPGPVLTASSWAGPSPTSSTDTSPAPLLGELGAGELSDLVAAHTMAVRRAEAVVLELGCAWADRFPRSTRAPHLSAAMRSAAQDYAADVGSPVAADRLDQAPTRPLGQPALVLGTGGEGTPEVSVWAVAEFAVLRRVSIGSGHALIADALDLRHRLPGLYRLTGQGAMTLSMARRAARETRHLSSAQATEVDSWLVEVASGIGWSRFCTLLEAAVIEADPARAAERAAAAARAQDVWTRRDPEGLATVVARIEAGDAAVLWATVNRIADILKVRLPGMPVGQRRAKALGLLARPLQALALLVAHAEDPDRVDLLDDLDGTTDEDSAADHLPARCRPGPETAGYDEPHPEHPHGPEPDAWVDHHGDPDPEPTTPVPPPDVPRPGPQPAPPARDEPRLTEPSRTTTEPSEPGSPGGLESDLTRLREAISRSAMGLDQWVTRAWERGAPPATVVFHLADTGGLVRPEHPGGPITVDQLGDYLAGTGARVSVQPVIDPAHQAAVDSYEISPRLRRALRTRNPASCFPWSTNLSPSMDVDHTRPYRRGPDRPPAQTGMPNLGPLGRREHRVRTFGRFEVRQPVPGMYLWRTPTGHHYLVTATGTTHLGRDAAAQQLWTAAGSAAALVPEAARGNTDAARGDPDAARGDLDAAPGVSEP